MCDDWNDLIEYVVQIFFKNLRSGGGGQIEHVVDVRGDQIPTIIATPATPVTSIISLKRRLVNSGSFSSTLFKRSSTVAYHLSLQTSLTICNWFNFPFRVPETIGLDSVVIIDGLLCTPGYIRRPRVSKPSGLSQSSTKRILPDGTVDGNGSIGSSFRNIFISFTPYGPPAEGARGTVPSHSS